MKKLLLFLMAPLFFACQRMDPGPDVSSLQRYRIKLAVGCEETSSKSVFSASEKGIENLHVWVYDAETSKLMHSFLFSETSVLNGNLDISLHKRESYTFLFLANMTGIEAPANLSEALAMRYRLDDELTLKRLFPMSLSMKGVSVSDGMTVNVYLQRMVAKYTFRVDRSKLKGSFTLKSVCVRQSAMDASVFAESAATVVADGDSATDADINLVSAGGPAFFYMLENCRGTLTPGNTDPWKKIPSDPSEAALATYIEVHATYKSPTMQSSDITYRMYLGDNSTDSFDVTRNTVHVVALTPSDDGVSEGILGGQWKIDPGDYEIVGKLAFSRKTAVCAAVYNPPYILRDDGSSVSIIKDSVTVQRSSTKLSYSMSYDTASTNIEVSTDGDKAVFSPGSGLTPKGSFNMTVTSYDGLISDNATVYGGVMDLKVRFNHKTGIMQMWSGDSNPRGIKFHVKMNYEVYSSAWGGSSWSNLKEYKDSEKGSVEFDITPNMYAQNVDGGKICSAIRNQSDGAVPTPDGFTQYTPYLLKIGSEISVISPSEWCGRTVVRYNSGIFGQTSAGFVNNQYYMGFWYVSNLYDGSLIFHRKTDDGETTSKLSFVEICNGQQFRTETENYYSAAFEI